MEDWKGRITDPEKGLLYWYQLVEVGGMANVAERTIVLSGYPFDEGVRLNHGRVGAAEGPSAIRKMLAGCALSNVNLKILDAGDIAFSDSMKSTQKALAERTAKVLKSGGIPINLGGGHDISAGTGMGLKSAFPDKRLGIINLDAHFDLREPLPVANSGTPFYELSKLHDKFQYMVLGIQNEANTLDLFRTAAELNVAYAIDEEITDLSLQALGERVQSFLSNIDLLHLSIDMDVFPAAYAPGVSAVNPVGVEPKLVIKLLEGILDSGKVRAVDVAEMNPVYDVDNRTAKLAARLISKIVNKLF